MSLQTISASHLDSVEQPELTASSTLSHPMLTEAHSYLEFFAGSGLVAEGLKGLFKPIWANDISAKKRNVYVANHSEEHFHLGSIADVSGEMLPNAVLAWASFPCQDLSLAGQASGINGARSGLVWDWLRIIDEMPEAPPILVAENVLGLVSTAGGAHYKKLHAALSARGYVAGAMLLDAIKWVPQSRPRIFVVAVRADLKLPIDITDDKPNWLHSLAIQNAVKGINDFIWWKLPKPNERKTKLSDLIEWNATCANEETDQRNIKLISPKHALTLEKIPKILKFVAPGYKRTRNGKQVLELRFDDVAGCLRTPSGGSSRQWLVLGKKDNLKTRLLTIRETARLMGAPDSYNVPGSYNEGYQAMGDAVAVPVANWLGEHLLTPLANAIIANKDIN